MATNPKGRTSEMGEIQHVMYGLGHVHATPIKAPISANAPKSDNIWLGEDDDHQDETRQKAEL